MFNFIFRNNLRCNLTTMFQKKMRLQLLLGENIMDMYEAWVSEFAPLQSSKLLGAHHPTDPLHKCISFNQNWKLNVQELMLWNKKLQKCMIWNKKLLSLEV